MDKLMKTILIIALLYIFQFFVIPSLFASYYPISNESYIIFIITSIIFLSIGFYIANEKFIYWLISDVVYALLIIMCCSNGCLYGIGFSGLFLDGLQPSYSLGSAIIGSFVAAIVLIIIQLAIKGIMFVYKALKKR